MYVITDITNTDPEAREVVHTDKIGVEPSGELTFRVPAEGWPGRYVARSFPFANVELEWINDQLGVEPGTL